MNEHRWDYGANVLLVHAGTPIFLYNIDFIKAQAVFYQDILLLDCQGR